MAFPLNNMLEDMTHNGYKWEELRETVLIVLDEFFENKTRLEMLITDSQILSIFSYIIIYREDNLFIDSLWQSINIYREAYNKNFTLFKETVLSSINLISQKENLMWTVTSNTPHEVSDDIHEATYVYMKHIGDTLEIGFKHLISELYSMLCIKNSGTVDYLKIQNIRFGSIIQNFIDKAMFIDILKTELNNIKISDWRNISYHHTYEIIENKIKCSYGNKGEVFFLSIQEMEKYTARIVRTCNIISLARQIVLLDKDNIFSSFVKDDFVDDREIMKINQLYTSLLTQSFKMEKYDVSESEIRIELYDLLRDTCENSEAELRREIHCSQFLYNIWLKFPKNNIIVTYCDISNKLFEYSVSGDVCKKIQNGDLNFNNFFSLLNMRKL